MELKDAINLGITIGLGILSLGLGIMSIWLSIYFARESGRAFEKINQLTNDIKMLTNNTLTNQQKYSDKMLDTIIEQSKYGTTQAQPDSRTPDLTLKLIAEEIKDDLGRKINSKLDEVSKSMQLSQEVRTNISKSIKGTEVSYDEIQKKIDFPDEIRTALESLKTHPAHYILLRGIILSGATSEKELDNRVSEYQIPSGWDNGVIDKLISLGILAGTSEKFSIPKNLVVPFNVWLEKNALSFGKILQIYKNKTKTTVTEEEVEIARTEFRF